MRRRMILVQSWCIFARILASSRPKILCCSSSLYSLLLDMCQNDYICFLLWTLFVDFVPAVARLIFPFFVVGTIFIMVGLSRTCITMALRSLDASSRTGKASDRSPWHQSAFFRPARFMLCTARSQTSARAPFGGILRQSPSRTKHVAAVY